jgi:hypothetical protein
MTQEPIADMLGGAAASPRLPQAAVYDPHMRVGKITVRPAALTAQLRVLRSGHEGN